MKYKFLKKFLRIPEDRLIRSDRVFSCGIGYYYGIGGLCISHGLGGDLDVAFILTVKDNIQEWRQKKDLLTSSAEYDLIVTRIK